jgi:hypothetical protein
MYNPTCSSCTHIHLWTTFVSMVHVCTPDSDVSVSYNTSCLEMYFRPWFLNQEAPKHHQVPFQDDLTAILLLLALVTFELPATPL